MYLLLQSQHYLNHPVTEDVAERTYRFYMFDFYLSHKFRHFVNTIISVIELVYCLQLLYIIIWICNN